MTVLICNDVPPALRGHLKRWFIEPRANVFVGSLNERTHRKTMEFIVRNAPRDFGCLCVASEPNCQGYTILRIGPEGKTGRREVCLSGISLVAEAWSDPDNCPF